MRKYLSILIAAAVIWMATPIFPVSHAQAASKDDKLEQPKLTDEQLMELNGIRQEVLEKRIKLINKYVDYGVLTREKGDAIISDMVKREASWKKAQDEAQNIPKNKLQKQKSKKEQPSKK